MRIKPEWSVEFVEIGDFRICAVKCEVEAFGYRFSGSKRVYSHSADAIMNWRGGNLALKGAILDLVSAIAGAEEEVTSAVMTTLGFRPRSHRCPQDWMREVDRVPELDIERIEEEGL